MTEDHADATVGAHRRHPGGGDPAELRSSVAGGPGGSVGVGGPAPTTDPRPASVDPDGLQAQAAERRPRVWLITGASRGIGRALAELARERGDAVVAGHRDSDGLEAAPGLVPVALDVTSPSQCAAAVATALSSFGHLDVVANVAGVGLVGAIEETPADQARALFEVNFWGVANLLGAALPVLRGQRSGHVLQVSSVSGRVAAAGIGYYAASKFALEGLSEALHAELDPLGIRLTIVEPGGVRTDWAGSSLWSAPLELADYEATAGVTRRLLASVDGSQPSLPEEVAATIATIVEAPDPPRRVAATADAAQRIGEYLDAEREGLGAWVADAGVGGRR